VIAGGGDPGEGLINTHAASAQAHAVRSSVPVGATATVTTPRSRRYPYYSVRVLSSLTRLFACAGFTLRLADPRDAHVGNIVIMIKGAYERQACRLLAC